MRKQERVTYVIITYEFRKFFKKKEREDKRMKPSHYKRFLSVLLCICLVLPVGVPTQTAAAKDMTGTVTATSLNVRSGAGTNYDKLKVNGVNAYLTKGQTATILKESNGWYYIQFDFNGTAAKGYVLKDYMQKKGTTAGSSGNSSSKPQTTPTPTVTPVPTVGIYATSLEVKENANEIAAAVNASVLNLRSKASTSGKVVAKLTAGMLVTIVNEVNTKSGKWYKIQVEDTDVVGYVLSNYISIVFDETIKGYINSEAKVYPRKTANAKGAYVKNSSGSKLGLSNEKVVTILSEKTVAEVKWFRISFKVGSVTYKGYVKADQVRFKQTIYEKEEVIETPTPTKKPTATPTPTKKPTATPTPSPTQAVSAYTIQGAELRNYSTVTLYAAAGFSQNQLTDLSGNLIYITSYTPFAVYDKVSANGYDWYYVGVMNNGIMYYGYTLSEYVNLNSTYDSEVKEWPAPDMPNSGGDGSATTTVTPTPTSGVISNEAFEAKLTEEGFPESYKVLLRKLHEKYPFWEFEGYQTGLNWSDAIAKESSVGLNLITNRKAIEWKSFASGAYNWKTDKFIAYDGSTWVTASEAAVAYYMDPRNFLNEDGIFQFELLSYRSSYQNAAGVENILKNTALSNQYFTYLDENGVLQSYSYADAFIAAAQYSNVSPYHLATRVKQEVVTGTNSLSNSVSGTVSDYEGLYNFYNIGAYHSTTSGEAVINALKYALSGSGNVALDALYRIPWDNPYDAIVGGAYIIGRNYINRGDAYYHSQDTIYLQKFNVTNKTTYSHQYMANIEAAFAESKKMYSAYDNLASLPIVFSIPIYNNMPSEAAAYPTTQYNPNNWLKTLSITDSTGTELVMTPTFDIAGSSDYSLFVTSDVTQVNVSATTVSSKATILSGTGMYALNVGTNQFTITVVAENGDLRAYNIYIVKP